MTDRSCLTIVLAAGKGTRMRSELPKVLHAIAGRPMLGHVLDAAREGGSDRLAVVVGHEAERVRAFLATETATETFDQTEQLGTAHAVLAARDAISRGFDDVLVLFGDTPLLTGATLRAARQRLHDSGSAAVVVGFRDTPPNAYGRLLVEGDELVAIREAKEATEAELAIDLCNGGIMAIDGRRALELIDRIGNRNAKGEYYLTDIVEIARAEGLRSDAIEVDPTEVLGVNDRVELSELERLWQDRRRAQLLREGVTMQAPDTVWLHHDTKIEADATVEPFVVFGPGATVAANATVRAHSHVEGARIEGSAVVGPFARLRPGTVVGERAKVGNFCETKNARIADGAKVNHLSYIGDAEIGAGANVGAGTITCNYDGFGKYRTVVGENAFVGSNTSLVAPITLGRGAYVASGSVLTKDVPDDALALARGKQDNKNDYAPRLRERARARAGAERKN